MNPVNPHYPAATGWDAASGLGALDGTKFLNAMLGTQTPPPVTPPPVTPPPVVPPPVTTVPLSKILAVVDATAGAYQRSQAKRFGPTLREEQREIDIALTKLLGGS